MEELRAKLEQAINKYGTNDKRVVSISQDLDKFILVEQKKIGRGLY